MPAGRRTLFPKAKHRVAGFLTADGSRRFEAARRRLAELVGWKPSSVSDGNTAEFLARGEADAIEYLRKTGQLKGE